MWLHARGQTIQITLFESAMGPQIGAAIVAIQHDLNPTLITLMVGSGPFRFKADERVQGALVVYERFGDYRPREDSTPDWTSGPKVAHFDRVEWHVIPDEATALNALRLGEVDWMEVAPADLLDELRQDRNITLDLLDPTGFSAILAPIIFIRRSTTARCATHCSVQSIRRTS